jgi:hypothetical protein
MLLQEEQLGRWGVYLADPAPTLGDIECSVFGDRGFLVKDVGESAGLKLK